ncbi:hypothetical protein NCAS_0J00100 [Naumovozyma castellii]|uniref:Glycosyltransferase family 91 protein n=1 Tax=Naumovozyma castellii TaxID=27288 RepID=G0VKF6_NAUCA|nr:hypothetical protein NCAS_0J00100 [Naumovozyma castellii CBS 4309]CCC71990.1 hypothetical protein NCAS_0J00100 [Naumovozyma castellii CBS 4309]
MVFLQENTLFRILFIIVIPIIIIICLLHPNGKESLQMLGYQYYNSNYGAQVVNRKEDLLKTDITTKLRFKNWSQSPLNDRIRNQEFVKDKLTGYISNLNLEKHHSKFASGGSHSHRQLGGKNEAEFHKDYDSLVKCEDLQYVNTVEHSEWNKVLDDDLLTLRRDLLKNNDFLGKDITDPSEKNWSEEEIINKHWFRFGGSSVWLDKYECHLVFSRVLYARKGVRDHPHVSMIRAQAFDRDWNEIKEKRIPYNDITHPKDLDLELKKLDHELGLFPCDSIKHNTEEFDACVVEHTKSKIVTEKRKEKIMSRYFLTYPTVLDIRYRAAGDWLGPEDPHVIVRKTKDIEEPVVIFNMYDGGEGARRVFSFMPSRKNTPLLKFNINDSGRKFNSWEKNWTPFFHQHLAESAFSRGSIHFIYTFSPLEILKCSLNDGVCSMVFEAKTLDLSKDNKFGGWRGGTQYIPLPEVLPQVKNKQIWVGFPKLHIDRCGCGLKFYRPMLSLLVESNGAYHQELAVPDIDFDMDVLSWDQKGTHCGQLNVLSPNAISYWEVASQAHHSKKYEDYMALSFSEADANTRVIVLRGILNYILEIYEKKAIMEDFEVSSKSDLIIGRTLKCVVQKAKEDCKAYGKSHPEPKKD